jgi:hypothetical protein
MHGFHSLEHRSVFVAASFSGLSLSSSWREDSLLRVFARPDCGFVAGRHRLAWLFDANDPCADEYCRSLGRVGMVAIRK